MVDCAVRNPYFFFGPVSPIEKGPARQGLSRQISSPLPPGSCHSRESGNPGNSASPFRKEGFQIPLSLSALMLYTRGVSKRGEAPIIKNSPSPIKLSVVENRGLRLERGTKGVRL